MPRKTNYATKKRQVILDILKDNNEKDFSVKEIEGCLKQTDIDINVTTIYRYLDRLAESGQLLKHSTENGKNFTYQYIAPEKKCDSHLHMKCSICGRIYHLECEFMNELKKHIYKHHAFTLECKTSMLYGICDECQKRQNMEK